MLREYYGELIRLRKSLPAMAQADKAWTEAQVEGGQVVALHYLAAAGAVCVLLNFARTPSGVEVELRSGVWNKLLDSADRRWGGEGAQRPLKCGVSRRLGILPPQTDLRARCGMATRMARKGGVDTRGWVSN